MAVVDRPAAAHVPGLDPRLGGGGAERPPADGSRHIAGVGLRQLGGVVAAQHGDAAVPQIGEVAQGGGGPARVVGADRGPVRPARHAIGQHQGNAGGGRLVQPREAHGGVDDGVDPTALQGGDGLGGALGAVAEVHHEQDVIGGVGGLGGGGQEPAAEGGGGEGVGDQADGAGGVAPQAPGDVVRPVVQLLGGLEDPVPGGRRDVPGVAPVEHERDGRRGDSGRGGDVGGAHARPSLRARHGPMSPAASRRVNPMAPPRRTGTCRGPRGARGLSPTAGTAGRPPLTRE